MKTTVCVLVVFGMVALCGAAEPKVYHFSAYTFETQQRIEHYKVFEEGIGSPDICKQLFTPMLYNGYSVGIPTNAIAFGVVAVTDGETIKIIPLFRWSDEKGKQHCACNGPSPWYARHEETQQGLLKSIVGAIKKK